MTKPKGKTALLKEGLRRIKAVLQTLYRKLSIYSNGYIREKIVVLKLTVGLMLSVVFVYGVLFDLTILLIASSTFIFDYIIYRAYMVERYWRIEEYARQFELRKLMDAEGANRPITEQELENPLWTEETQRVLETIRKGDFGAKDIALDIGCGSGKMTLGLLEHGIRTISLDITHRALKLTDSIAKRDGYTTERVLGDAQNLPFRSMSLSLVVALSVIEHLPNDVTGFRESVRILKHGGQVFFSFPSHHSPVFSLYGFFFNPIVLSERLFSWKLPSILPRRGKFVYLGELFLTHDKAHFEEVSIHRLYNQRNIKCLLTDFGLAIKLQGSISARGGRLASGQLDNIARRCPFLAHVFVVSGIKR